MLPQNLIPTETPTPLDESRAVEFRSVDRFIDKNQSYIVWGVGAIFVLIILASNNSFWGDVRIGLFGLVIVMSIQRLPLWWLTKARYSCPHTSKYLEPFESWKCPYCDRVNNTRKSGITYSYITGCPNCKERADAIKSPWTDKLIYLSRPRRSEFVAVKEGDKWSPPTLVDSTFAQFFDGGSSLVTEADERQLISSLRGVTDALQRDTKVRLWKRSIETRLRNAGKGSAEINSAMRYADEMAKKYK